MLNADYAVRGAIVIRANQIQTELAKGTDKYGFKKVIYCNIGNPQDVGQKPLTFHRQVMATCLAPQLLKSNDIPSDGWLYIYFYFFIFFCFMFEKKLYNTNRKTKSVILVVQNTHTYVHTHTQNSY